MTLNLHPIRDEFVCERRRDGRRFLYAPAIPEDTWVADTGLSLIDRLFGGRLAPLVAQFASERKLGDDDIAALKAQILASGLSLSQLVTTAWASAASYSRTARSTWAIAAPPPAC